MKLHIDIETYSSTDLRSSGVYKHAESPDFEILMVAYALGDSPVGIIDLACGDALPREFLEALSDPTVEKYAHNALFERTCFAAYGLETDPAQWRCTAVKAGYCGLPMSLAQLSAALRLGDKAKMTSGKDLIKYFSLPVKGTKANGGRTRNLPHHNPEKWEAFKEYCVADVVAEREVCKKLESYEIPAIEQDLYTLDQKINDTGMLVDVEFAKTAQEVDLTHTGTLIERMKVLTGLDNPNSSTQLKEWLTDALGKEVKSVAKANIEQYAEEVEAGQVGNRETILEVLKLRLKTSKTSVKKYLAMSNCALDTGRAHGLFQFYGASRTGRWAGRLIQLQNLPRNKMEELDGVREMISTGDYDYISMMYEDVSDVMSQLIRTALIAPRNHILLVADFSAIEARVIAWLAGEQWRLDVFNSHGKIYEASASMMFSVPIEEIGKDSPLRQRGKVAELALGYQGSVGALKKMGAEEMGLKEPEMKRIVEQWRAKNPKIVTMWGAIDRAAKRCLSTGKRTVLKRYADLAFEYDGNVMTIELPSGRKLFYQSPRLTKNKWGGDAVQYKGLVKGQWVYEDTYGGKITENIIQAIARDLLAVAMLRLDKAGYKLVMHVHDEAVAELYDGKAEINQKYLDRMCEIMGQEVEWAKGLPTRAEGFITKFFRK